MSVYIHNIILGSESHYNNIDWISDLPNYAGGFGVHVDITNIGAKTINYVKMTFIPHNGVGDIVACTARGHVEANITATGPFSPGETKKYNFDCLWYNETIKRLELKAVLVKYADGTEEAIPVNKATSRPIGETNASKIIRLEQRLETINNNLRGIDLTGTGRKKSGKTMTIIGGVFLAICVLGFVSGAVSDSGFWLFLYLFVGAAGALMLFSGMNDMKSNPEDNAVKAKNFQRQMIEEKQKVEAELNKLKNDKTSADPTLGNWGADDDYWE